jgi:cell division protein FtsW (lipid II flippase)
MEEYLKVLMEQIRCKKVHPYIKQEICGHLEEQIEDNMSEGMSREEAEKAAVADMGSPVEAGIALDKVHRPKMNWGVVGLMTIISIAGIVLHELMWRQIGVLALGSRDFVKYTLLGFSLMLVVYRLDYSVIARYSKVIAAGMLAACFVAYAQGNFVDGISFLHVMNWNLFLYCPMLLYVPIYGAVIYKYHGQGLMGLCKAILWMIIPVLLAWRLPMMMLSGVLLVSMMIVLTVALAKGWFQVKKKSAIAALWGCGVGMPLAFLAIMANSGIFKEYQIARIKGFFSYSSNMNVHYITWRIREMLENCQVIGNGNGSWMNVETLMGYIPECNTAYVFAYVLYNYGILAGILLGAVLVFLLFMIFRISFKQKNELAIVMGCGCGMAIGVNVLINIAENLGLMPVTETFLPFFSRGGGGILVCYIMMGIILSIYRYKNIYPKHVNTELGVARISIRL